MPAPPAHLTAAVVAFMPRPPADPVPTPTPAPTPAPVVVPVVGKPVMVAKAPPPVRPTAVPVRAPVPVARPALHVSSLGRSAFPWGQCTWWVATQLPVTWSGNASSWAWGARAAGWWISSSPSVGSIAIYRPGMAGAGWMGHVAVVVAVSRGSYTVSEMNYRGLGVLDYRTVGYVPGVVFASR